ncbi:hypothetical protein [Oceanobacillus polygoni]|uniref:Uncharacterized protein n=1 Tax=Oceanobacillus polygoni TaxID=1235259 RepID=A0A9X0YUS2_9BACI|nr:hypothetical protein [Oceanobacillus polygoni]MBP2079217.1 hypothetical protein [Oceanobacillus polygoni]
MNWKKVIAVLVGAVLLFVTGYFVNGAVRGNVYNYDFTLKGESDNWEASFRVIGEERFYKRNGVNQYDSYATDELQLIFKGTDKELAAIKKIHYEYTSPAGSGSTTMEIDESLTDRVFTHSGGGNGAFVREDQIVEVTVEWDNQMEVFELVAED